jgi:LDH2 family malate/lactate/ureidoglycolate dehydrogenase
MSQEDASICAEAMVWSDLRGVPRHGLTGRLPQLVDRIRAGGVNTTPRWDVVRQSPGTAMLDADGGWGQVAGTRGMLLAVAGAKKQGIGMAVVRDADITAALGWYAHVAIREHMIGLAINNTTPLLAPWGSDAKILGSQPFAIGTPSARHHPILFDSTLASMSNGAIEAAHQRGEALPPGVALDAHGKPTVDPIEALAGQVLPMGGYRGYGLALMWEVLTGVLGGGRMTPNVGGAAPLDKAPGISLFCLAIDPAASMPYEAFVSRVDDLIDQMHAASPAPGVDRVRVPGELGYEAARVHELEGVPVDEEHAARLRVLGDEYGVSCPV